MACLDGFRGMFIVVHCELNRAQLKMGFLKVLTGFRIKTRRNLRIPSTPAWHCRCICEVFKDGYDHRRYVNSLFELTPNSGGPLVKQLLPIQSSICYLLKYVLTQRLFHNAQILSKIHSIRVLFRSR